MNSEFYSHRTPSFLFARAKKNGANHANSTFYSRRVKTHLLILIKKNGATHYKRHFEGILVHE